MGFTNKYPYTDFHELNLDWFIGQMAKIEEGCNCENIGTVKYYYVDATYGDNNNDGETASTAFKTLAHALKLINEGVKDLGVYFVTSGTYTIPNDLRTLTTATLHLRNYNNSDVTLQAENGTFVVYASHLSWYGSAGHLFTIDIPTFRVDGGQFWADYVHFKTRLVDNGANCKFRWCKFSEESEFTHANLILQEPTFYYTDATQLSQIVLIGGCCQLRDSITCENDIAKGTDSRIFELHSAVLGLEPDMLFNTTLTNKYDYFARTYAAMVYSRYTERDLMPQLASKPVFSSGYEINDLMSDFLWVNQIQPGDDLNDLEGGMSYFLYTDAGSILNNPFPRVGCMVETTRAYNNATRMLQTVRPWTTGYTGFYATRRAENGNWTEWTIVRDAQPSNSAAITVIGDSLASGYIYNSDGFTAQDYYEESWPAYLSYKWGWKYYISGRTGIRTSHWIGNQQYGELGLFARLPKTPIYILALGMNDATGGVAQATFETNYKYIIDAIRTKAPDALIFCLKLWRNTGVYPTYNTYIDNVLALYASDPKVTSIDITTEVNSTPISSHEYSGHFDPIGYRYIADAIDSKILAFSDANPQYFRQGFAEQIRTNLNTIFGFPFPM